MNHDKVFLTKYMVQYMMSVLKYMVQYMMSVLIVKHHTIHVSVAKEQHIIDFVHQSYDCERGPRASNITWDGSCLNCKG